MSSSSATGVAPQGMFGATGDPSHGKGIPYQISFNPNCTCRDVVEVLVIAPAVPETPEGVVGGAAMSFVPASGKFIAQAQRDGQL